MQVYTQTDNAPNCSVAAYCSGLTAGLNQGPVAICSVGGTAGSVEDTGIVDLSATDFRYFYYEITIPSGTTGDAGTWVVRLNNTTGDANLTLASIHICRVNSSCANQETIGSTTGLSDVLNSSGVISTNVTGSAVTLAEDDKVMIIIGVTNPDSMFSFVLGFTPDQNIDSPFSDVVALVPSTTAAKSKYRMVYRQRLRRI